MNMDPSPTCGSPSCGCQHPGGRPALARRDFLRTLGIGTSTVLLEPWAAMAGPFSRMDFAKLVPADKKLRPEWVASLFARGTRAVYRGADLEKIGMPIGGIGCGQIYLGGDGRLWHWDIFNRHLGTGADHYAKPMPVESPFDQGFAIRIRNGNQIQERVFDRHHWPDVSFNGEYPIGRIEYRDAASPVSVSLEAFSPFIPLNVADSSLPATVLQFTVKNEGTDALEIELAGWLENAVCLHSSRTRSGNRRNCLRQPGRFLFLECSAEDAPSRPQPDRPDIVLDDFENETYRDWSVRGTAFGTGPIEITKMPAYQGDVGGQGRRVVNSHASAPGPDVAARDAAKGMLTSQSFTIVRHYITFLIGGGRHKDQTCVNLVVEDQVVLSATGVDSNHMVPSSWDVRRWAGKPARLQIVDDQSGGWGNISVDDIVFSDHPRPPVGDLGKESDFGTMGLALLAGQTGDSGATDVPTASLPQDLFLPRLATARKTARKPFGQKLVGALTRKMKLRAGQSGTATFLIAWHMPNLKMDRLPPGREYARRFNSALEVVAHVARNFTRLSYHTRLWHDTWYDSTLPFWFLDRTFLNTSILATSTCYRFGNGRFYGWEGVGCCEGTCGHVWQYAHAAARLFPELERTTRETVDFGLALQPDGAIHFRGEFNNIPAIDGQAGTVLRALREHQMAADRAFLDRNWPGIRKALEWLIAKDADADGLIESNQHNTLDTDWYGPVAWLSGLYLGALRAGEQMAGEMGDSVFAQKCRTIFAAGQKNIVARLFDDGYFVNKPDPRHADAINSGTGCHIDQVMGQSWAFQVGLGRVLPALETRSALQSLWRFNFTPDVGPYRQAYQPGRWYAMPGEAGLLMCTFPRTDWDYDQAKGKGLDWAAGYFNECMNGFEYQVAGHMIWEGMLLEGLAITRAVHDRYHPARRNPWNEVECGDHYARSMASYGVFLAACGYAYHGPRGELAFVPRLTPHNFRAAFTTAEGWGTFIQSVQEGQQIVQIDLKWGRLSLKQLSLGSVTGPEPFGVIVTLTGKKRRVDLKKESDLLRITFTEDCQLRTGDRLEVKIRSLS